jgi:hypothetical protein
MGGGGAGAGRSAELAAEAVRAIAAVPASILRTYLFMWGILYVIVHKGRLREFLYGMLWYRCNTRGLSRKKNYLNRLNTDKGKRFKVINIYYMPFTNRQNGVNCTVLYKIGRVSETREEPAPYYDGGVFLEII